VTGRGPVLRGVSGYRYQGSFGYRFSVLYCEWFYDTKVTLAYIPRFSCLDAC
jgi:hypothetical protein